VKDEGLYVIRWYGLAGGGTQALSTSLRALLDRFPPGSDRGDGRLRRAREGRRHPVALAITNPSTTPGRAVSTVTVPFYVTDS
jgi:hypothetical protein